MLIKYAHSPNIHWIALVIFGLSYISFFPFSAVHQDFARDVFVGLRIADSISLPTQGPILAATIHMGPAWYYLLGLLLKLCRSWIFVAFVVALLSALQFPLAYVLGKELGGRFVGIVWASLLLIPSWSSFEQVYPLHYQITATLVLALLLQAVKFYKTAHWHHALAMMLYQSLALHAHPTTVCFVLVTVPLLTGALLAKRIQTTKFLASFAIAALPFVPYVIGQMQSGFPDAHAAARYLGNSGQVGSIQNILPLLVSVTIGGTCYWFSEFIALNTPLVMIVVVILIALQVAGGGGWFVVPALQALTASDDTGGFVYGYGNVPCYGTDS